VVDGCRTELDREAHAVARAELIRVEPRRETRLDARTEDATGLVDREGTGLAEDVDPARVRRARGEHLTDDEIYIGVAIVGVLGRHDVRAEEGHLVGDLPGEAHETLLVGDAQAVAALDLEGRGALRVQLVDEAGEPVPKLVVGRRPGRGHGRADAACFVAAPGHARGELVGPVAAEHEVRVGVDEAGDHRATAHVDDLDVGVPRRAVLVAVTSIVTAQSRCEFLHVGGRTDPGDMLVFDEDRRVTDDPERAAVAVGCRLVRDELADVRQQHPPHRTSVAHASSIGTRRPRSRATSIARS
jgi:hypothetical protein